MAASDSKSWGGGGGRESWGWGVGQSGLGGGGWWERELGLGGLVASVGERVASALWLIEHPHERRTGLFPGCSPRRPRTSLRLNAVRF